MPPRPFLLMEANHRQLLESPPKVAILPWGATESHNFHLPYGTDVIEATRIAAQSAETAYRQGASIVVLPTVPFGNDEQQLDQACTISFTTSTALAVLNDVVRSLAEQRIDRLVIVNGHGGNQFQPLVRDIQNRYGVLIVVANFYQMASELKQTLFEEPGDHADEMETSLLLHLCPDLVELSQAGPGLRNTFAIQGLNQAGVWTPRPWSLSHPDTGSGNPSKGTAEKGQLYFEAVCDSLADLLVNLAKAEKGDLPFV